MKPPVKENEQCTNRFEQPYVTWTRMKLQIENPAFSRMKVIWFKQQMSPNIFSYRLYASIYICNLYHNPVGVKLQFYYTENKNNHNNHPSTISCWIIGWKELCEGEKTWGVWIDPNISCYIKTAPKNRTNPWLPYRKLMVGENHLERKPDHLPSIINFRGKLEKINFGGFNTRYKARWNNSDM